MARLSEPKKVPAPSFETPTAGDQEQPEPILETLQAVQDEYDNSLEVLNNDSERWQERFFDISERKLERARTSPEARAQEALITAQITEARQKANTASKRLVAVLACAMAASFGYDAKQYYDFNEQTGGALAFAGAQAIEDLVESVEGQIKKVPKATEQALRQTIRSAFAVQKKVKEMDTTLQRIADEEKTEINEKSTPLVESRKETLVSSEEPTSEVTERRLAQNKNPFKK